MSNFDQLASHLGERYKLGTLLGSGGYSRVYRATQLDLDREVALKVISLEEHGDLDEASVDDSSSSMSGQNLVSRFEREARLVSKLKSPHTVTVYDHGRAGDFLFMAMEYVDGDDLKSFIEKTGPISGDRIAAIARQVLMSLDEAHHAGLLHRDIKPQNIMVFDHLAQRDQVRLLDFGIVKLTGDAIDQGDDLTQSNTLLGTPRYMAPEYVRDGNYTRSSDLYSLGLVLYELACGEPAIPSGTNFNILSRQLDPESFTLPEGLGDVDLELRLIIDKLMEKNPSARYKTVGQVMADLERRAEDRMIAVVSASHAIITRQRRSNLPLLLVSLALGAVIAGWWSSRGRVEASRHAPRDMEAAGPSTAAQEHAAPLGPAVSTLEPRPDAVDDQTSPVPPADPASTSTQADVDLEGAGSSQTSGRHEGAADEPGASPKVAPRRARRRVDRRVDRRAPPREEPTPQAAPARVVSPPAPATPPPSEEPASRAVPDVEAIGSGLAPVKALGGKDDLAEVR